MSSYGNTLIPQDYIQGLPNVDNPDVFGQHPNADIASQIRETRLMKITTCESFAQRMLHTCTSTTGFTSSLLTPEPF